MNPDKTPGAASDSKAQKIVDSVDFLVAEWASYYQEVASQISQKDPGLPA